MFRRKWNFSFANKKTWKSDKHFGSLKLSMLAKMDHGSFKSLSFIWLNWRKCFLAFSERNVFRRYSVASASNCWSHGHGLEFLIALKLPSYFSYLAKCTQISIYFRAVLVRKGRTTFLTGSSRNSVKSNQFSFLWTWEKINQILVG